MQPPSSTGSAATAGRHHKPSPLETPLRSLGGVTKVLSQPTVPVIVGGGINSHAAVPTSSPGCKELLAPREQSLGHHQPACSADRRVVNNVATVGVNSPATLISPAAQTALVDPPQRHTAQQLLDLVRVQLEGAGKACRNFLECAYLEDRFEVCGVLGSGSHSTVYLVQRERKSTTSATCQSSAAVPTQKRNSVESIAAASGETSSTTRRRKSSYAAKVISLETHSIEDVLPEIDISVELSGTPFAPRVSRVLVAPNATYVALVMEVLKGEELFKDVEILMLGPIGDSEETDGRLYVPPPSTLGGLRQASSQLGLSPHNFSEEMAPSHVASRPATHYRLYSTHTNADTPGAKAPPGTSCGIGVLGAGSKLHGNPRVGHATHVGEIAHRPSIPTFQPVCLFPPVCDSKSPSTTTIPGNFAKEVSAVGGHMLVVETSPISAREAEVRDQFHQLLISISELHKRGITHRDIKLENIIRVPPKEPSQSLTHRKSLEGGSKKKASALKLIDFGLARRVPPLPEPSSPTLQPFLAHHPKAATSSSMPDSHEGRLPHISPIPRSRLPSLSGQWSKEASQASLASWPEHRQCMMSRSHTPLMLDESPPPTITPLLMSPSPSLAAVDGCQPTTDSANKQQRQLFCRPFSDVVGSSQYVAPDVLRASRLQAGGAIRSAGRSPSSSRPQPNSSPAPFASPASDTMQPVVGRNPVGSSNAGYGLEVDVWAAGVCLYLLLFGKYPFAAERSSQQYRNILSGRLFIPNKLALTNVSSVASSSEQSPERRTSLRERERATASVDGDGPTPSPAVLALLTALLTVDPNQRITASAALKHSWFTSMH